LPIVFWDLTSAANSSRAQITAETASAFADNFYRTQGAGIAMPPIPSITRLGPSKVVNCETLGNAGVVWPGSINVYIVDAFDTPKTIGRDCGGGYVLIRFDSTTVALWVLAHELGHEFSLEHPDCSLDQLLENILGHCGYIGGTAPGFDNRNLMWSTSPVPQSELELSVGQIFRMNFNHDSALNFGLGIAGPDEINNGIQALDSSGKPYPSVWGAAPNKSPLHCQPVAPSPAPQGPTATCPAVCKRLWEPLAGGTPYPACTLEQ
jgi:hypothetical protein